MKRAREALHSLGFRRRGKLWVKANQKGKSQKCFASEVYVWRSALKACLKLGW